MPESERTKSAQMREVLDRLKEDPKDPVPPVIKIVELFNIYANNIILFIKYSKNYT